MKQIPKNWKITTLGEVFSWGSGGTPSRSKPNYFGGNIPWIKTGELRENVILETEEYLTQEGLENSSAKLFPKGSIAIAMYGATVGRVGILGIDAATNQACAVATSYGETIENRLLYYYLVSQKDNFINSAQGGAQPNISQTIIKKYPFPLPPLAEQRRIVAKLDAAMERLRAVEAILDEVPGMLEDFRRSVLHWAVTGKLINSTKKLSKKTVREVCNKIQIGPFGSLLHKEDYVEGGIPLVNPSHINNSKIFPDKQYTVSKEKFNQLATYHLQIGDVIMGRRGEMGRCALITKKEDGWLCGTGSLFFRPDQKKVDPEFLQLYLSSPTVKDYLELNAKGSTMLNLNQKIVGNIPIQFPDIEAQKAIVQENNRLRGIGEILESKVAQIKNELSTLRHSLLTRTFRGELLSAAELAEVQAEADYEPASVLMEKIRTEKAKLEREIKERRKKAKGRQKTKKTGMKKTEDLRAVIAEKFKGKPFTFDELRKTVGFIQYEELKREIFSMLGDDVKSGQASLFESKLKFHMAFNAESGKIEFTTSNK